MRIKKRHLLIIGIALLSVGESFADKESKPIPKLSYTIPKGWKVHSPSEHGYRITYQIQHGSIRPCIVDSIDVLNGSLESLIKEEETMIKSYMPNLDGFYVEKFTATPNLEGFKMAYICQLEGKEIFQSHYIFDLKGRVQIFTCSSPPEQRAEFEAIFDGVMKTLITRESLKPPDMKE